MGLFKLSFLNNNGKIEWIKYLYLNDIGDFGFLLLALLALSPMSFKKGPIHQTNSNQKCYSQKTVNLINDTEFGLHNEKVWQNAFYLRMNTPVKGIYRCIILNTPIKVMKIPNDIWVISYKDVHTLPIV